MLQPDNRLADPIEGPQGFSKAVLPTMPSDSINHFLQIAFAAAAVVILLLTGINQPATAGEIFKCVGPDNKVSYSHKRCATNEQTDNILNSQAHTGTSHKCNNVEMFSRHIATQIHQQKSVESLVVKYGTQQISRIVLRLMLDIEDRLKQPNGNIEGVARGIGENCKKGEHYNTVSCRDLPQKYITETGVCAVTPKKTGAQLTVKLPFKKNSPAYKEARKLATQGEEW